MTITVDLPILVNIFQSVRNLEAGNQNLQTEIRDLRTDFTTRLEALEAQLAFQPPIQSLAGVNPNLSQELADDTTHVHGDLGTQEEDDVEEAFRIQMDDRLSEDVRPHEDDPAQEANLTREGENNPAHQDDTAHNDLTGKDEREATDINGSSPSIDEGITLVAQPVVPPPAAGTKRKRTVRDAPARNNYLGFMVRSSDTQLAENRGEQAKAPSRSESPFDNNVRHDHSLDDIIPAAAPQALQASSRPSAPPRRRETKKAKEAGLDEFVAEKQEDFTIRYDQILLLSNMYKANP